MKKLLTLIFAILCFSLYTQAQDKSSDADAVIYPYSDPMPSFPGGIDKMMDFIADSLRYPNIEACVQGRVILRFVVQKDGSLDSIHVMRSLESNFDKEAIRVVKAMPKWTPGRKDGENVAVWFTLPILFRLAH